MVLILSLEELAVVQLLNGGVSIYFKITFYKFLMCMSNSKAFSSV